MRLELSSDQRFLSFDLGERMRTLSFAIVGGGFGLHRRIVWHFVTRGELTRDVDPKRLLEERLSAQGLDDAVGLLTARYLAPYGDAEVSHHDCRARAIVTVGLGNALSVGDPPATPEPVGTINVAAFVSRPLTDEGLLEALAIAVEARTKSLLRFRYPSIVSGDFATGTGTDCFVIACPDAEERIPYAGKHTDVGYVLGKAVMRATHSATQRWLEEQGLPAAHAEEGS